MKRSVLNWRISIRALTRTGIPVITSYRQASSPRILQYPKEKELDLENNQKIPAERSAGIFYRSFVEDVGKIIFADFQAGHGRGGGTSCQQGRTEKDQ